MGEKASDGASRSLHVSYHDLDLNRQQDVARLYMRIATSADQLCGPRSLTGIHYKWAEYTSCYNDTVALGLIVDAFLVRTFFVPSVALLLGERNWWPRRFV